MPQTNINVCNMRYIVVLILCFVGLACKTPQQLSQQVEQQQESRHDSMALHTGWVNALLRQHVRIRLRDIQVVSPDCPADDSEHAPCPRPAVLHIGSLEIDSQTERQTSAGAKDSTAMTIEENRRENTRVDTSVAPDPFRWRYIFRIIILLAVVAGGIYIKFFKR